METFDGTVIKIDEANIISQEKVEDVLETTLGPDEGVEMSIDTVFEKNMQTLVLK